jgi:hypothetical protein
MTKTELIKLLPTFSKEDLEEIETNIFFILKPNKKEYLHEREMSLLYHSIASSIEATTGEKVIPYPIFIKKTGEATLTKLSDTRLYLDTFLVGVLAKEPFKVTIAIKVRFYNLFVSLILKFLKDSNIKINIANIIYFHEKFPAELYKSFPGYVENAILSKIVR